MEEKTYLKTADASVTSSRIAIGKQTFATRNIGSVRLAETSGSRWPYVVMLIGAVMASSPSSRFMGLVILLAAAVAAWTNRGKYTLVLMAGGGEVSAYASRDKDAMQKLHDAIVDAISSR